MRSFLFSLFNKGTIFNKNSILLRIDAYSPLTLIGYIVPQLYCRTSFSIDLFTSVVIIFTLCPRRVNESDNLTILFTKPPVNAPLLEGTISVAIKIIFNSIHLFHYFRRNSNPKAYCIEDMLDQIDHRNGE